MLQSGGWKLGSKCTRMMAGYKVFMCLEPKEIFALSSQLCHYFKTNKKLEFHVYIIL